MSTAAQLVLTMTSGLDVQSQVEIHRALHAQLHPEPTASSERVRLLGPLARMLDRWPDFMGRYNQPDIDWWDQAWPRVPILPREIYDDNRAEGTPSAQRLVQLFGGKHNGGWLSVCRAAYGVLPDGRYRGKGRPRPVHHMDDRGALIWDKQKCADAVRTCALAIGRRPSSTDYTRYQRAKARRLNHGDRVRFGLPTVQTVQNHLGVWPRVLKAARIHDEDLIAARRAWATEHEPDVGVGNSVVERLAALDAVGLMQAGISARKRDALVAKGPIPLSGLGVRGLEQMHLSKAVVLAGGLGGSLAWLLGDSAAPGEVCDPGTCLNVAAVRSWIEKRNGRHGQLRERLKLTSSQWKALMRGSSDLTVTQIYVVARILELPMATVLSSTSPGCA